MTTLCGHLAADHRACDELFAAAENAAGAGKLDASRAAFLELRQRTERHFAQEETVLFPAFEAATGLTMGPTEVMRGEHRQMRQLLAQMAEALAAGRGDDYLALSDTLLTLMQQHNAKEEHVLYPAADRVLAARAGELLRQFDAVEAPRTAG